jgi:hypothetical protein
MIACASGRRRLAARLQPAAGVLDAVTPTWLKNPAELASSGIALAAVISFASQ